MASEIPGAPDEREPAIAARRMQAAESMRRFYSGQGDAENAGRVAPLVALQERLRRKRYAASNEEVAELLALATGPADRLLIMRVVATFQAILNLGSPSPEQQEQMRTVARSLLDADNPFLQIGGVVLAEATEDRAAIPRIRELTQGDDMAVRGRAAQALAALTR